jgi:beta-mannosidase
MKTNHDACSLSWRLTGFLPYQWQWERLTAGVTDPPSDIAPIPAPVPGSVQEALRRAGLLPDWNMALNARTCEWVEHRHWMYDAELPRGWMRPGRVHRLRCSGLDSSGWVLVNGREVGRFANAFVPHAFDLTPALREKGNRLQIIFDCPPRWLGQFGYTSRMTEWKPRFNYGWDWMPRLVQIGIWDGLQLEVTDGIEFQSARCTASFDPARRCGTLTVWAAPHRATGCRVRLELKAGRKVIRSQDIRPDRLRSGVKWSRLPVSPWWPNGHGAQPLYTLTCRLLDARGREHDRREWRVGFKSVEWRPCDGAPAGADPWVCVVNGKPIFLQGVNWTPIRPHFADVREDDYRKRIRIYRDMGCNLFRVWGGAVLEKKTFYDLCDESGLLVWQEFPLSSSGVENWPPEDSASIETMAAIAASYIERRQHHASLLLWCGGNELQGSPDGRKEGAGKPVDLSHPLIRRLARVVRRMDPGRRFLPTSASGPRFMAHPENVGKGLHWDVHGPWSAQGPLSEKWTDYWEKDDALFRSELGCPAASPVTLIRRYSGSLKMTPGTLANPLWRRFYWWIDWREFVAERGREPRDLAEYVAWSQDRQKTALSIAVRRCKARFPACGGVILWMGHDSFPCFTNTAIVDFHGRPKPALRALRRIFRAGNSRIAHSTR